jgi:ComF family protein
LDDNGQCGLCRRGLTGFDAAFAYGCYEAVLREMVHLLKYGGVRSLASPMGAFLAAALPRNQRFDMVLPMPMHWMRRWRRGFNQAELLAAEVSKRTGISLASPVRRIRSTPPQAGLSRARRRENMSGAFAMARRADVKGKRVLLVDDVLTTGATASACAGVLKKAGAKYVAVLAVARADRRPGAALDAAGAATTTSVFGSVKNA